MAETASSGAGSVKRETTVNDTGRKRGRAADPVLPDDLFLWEIFYRLPAKAILHCRAACRSWHRLTCDDEFLLAHHHRQPSVPLVSFHSTINTNASVDAFYLRQTPAVSRRILGFNDYTESRSFTIHASCDGLLLLYLGNGRFYICNPATRQWLALPAMSGGNVAALYPHRPSGEYRVLYWKLPDKNISDSAVYVLTVGSSEEQRCIGLPVASPSMEIDTTRWLTRASEHPPALLHDCLHWYINGKVVVFDTLVESFRWMKSPIDTDSAHLLQMDGTLGIGHIDGHTKITHVWVLQDYETEKWSSKYQGELPAGTTFYGKVVSENGDMLGTVGPNRWSSSSLSHHDSKGKLLRKFRRKTANKRVLGLCFKESLVRHVFFSKRKDGKPPRFSEGCRGSFGVSGLSPCLPL